MSKTSPTSHWPHPNYVSLLRVIPNAQPRAGHSYMQRSVFGNDPYEFRAADTSSIDQPIGPLETAPEPWDHFLYRLATTTNFGARPYQISDFPPDYPPRSVEPDYSHLLSSRNSLETVHPLSKSTIAESVTGDSATAPRSIVEELSFSAIPMASQRRRSSAVEMRAARQPSVKIAQTIKSARLLGSVSGPIRSRRTARVRFANTLGIERLCHWQISFRASFHFAVLYY
ncbi:hypothetical protein CPB85DRAFT_1435742 [Mucidula mucida]|nr:hypothetical protein CPB85DRAFT_1435742 [Mucidula mucida]